MIDINKLKGKFVEKGYDTKEKQAGAIGMSTRTFSNKLQKKYLIQMRYFK